MDKNNFNKCNICKIRGYIECNLCENKVFFCSRGHLHTHQLKYHKDKKPNIEDIRSIQNSNFKNNINLTQKSTDKNIENNKNSKNNFDNLDPRKTFEQLQLAKNDIDIKIKKDKFSEAIININKLLNVSSRFYQEDHIFVII